MASQHPDLVRRYGQVRNPALLPDIAPAEIAEHVSGVTTIIEAGAFDGTDSRRLAAQWPEATIYAFEPVPELFGRLCLRVADLPNVRPQPYGLGASDTTATMTLSHRVTAPDRVRASSSLLSPTGHTRLIADVTFEGSVEVQVLALDSWMEHAGIARVDVAWLDLQGMELDVLGAAPRARSSLRAARLEVSRWPLYGGSPTDPQVNARMADWGFGKVLDRVIVPFGKALYVRSRGGDPR